MSGKTGGRSTGARSPLDDLGELLGNGSRSSPEQLDARLLWMSVVALLKRGAAIHLGMNKAGTSYIVTVYDGDYPHKEYCDNIERVHFTLAALVKVYGAKPLPPEWQEVVEQHFP